MDLNRILNDLDHILTPENIKLIIDYLKQYKYIGDSFDTAGFLLGVAKLHEAFGLPSGQLSVQTMKIINSSRCGMPDNIVQGDPDNQKWAYDHLLYKFDTFVPGLTKDQQRTICKRAYDSISAICRITFEETTNANQANIIITTGNQNGLGTPSGVLAYAYLPNNSANTQQLQLVLDLAELWIDDPNQRGILLQNVFCHESCHNLGLAHTNISTALMAPFYAQNIAVPQKNDDIPRLQKRYGMPKNNPVPPVTPPIPPVIPTTPSSDTLIKISGNINNISIDGYRITKLS